MNAMDVVKTADGSFTLFDPQSGEHYHSKHGAIGESRHVFLEMGLKHFLDTTGRKSATIFEVGFGTGLNFLVTADALANTDVDLTYYAVESSPLPKKSIQVLEFTQYADAALCEWYNEQYAFIFNKLTAFNETISLRVFPVKILDFTEKIKVDVIYFDAFSATHQPEMWTLEVLQRVISLLNPGGIFVTYSVTGDLKRTLKSLRCK